MERGVIAAWVGCNNAGFTLTALWLRQCESNVLERSVSFFGLLTVLRVSQCLWLLLGARSCCCDYCGASLLSPRPWAWVFCPLSFTAGSPLHASLSGSHDIPSLAWPGIVFVVYFVISVPGGVVVLEVKGLWHVGLDCHCMLQLEKQGQLIST